MANHPSAAKRARQSQKKRLENKYYARTTRSAVNKLRLIAEKEKAAEMLPGVSSMIDKLAKRSVIHKNKAANIKSSLTKHVNAL